jgi:predicted GNAT family acetyltransferase
VRRLEEWPCPPGGAVRHMFTLATIELQGSGPVRVVENGDRWAACVVQTGQLMVPAGDAEVVAAASPPVRRWRLTVGDAAAADAVLEPWRDAAGVVVHAQRFLVVDPERVPDEDEVADPGLRVAEPADLEGLADLAVELHVADEYGGHPGRSGRRNYQRRLEGSVRRRSVYVVGERGDPLVKIERAVDSAQYGVQLSGIVVREDARGSGLGTGAVAAAVRQAMADRPGTPIALHVRAANAPALRVYDRVGFVDREEWRLAIRA